MTISGQQTAQQAQQQRLYGKQFYWIWVARDSMLLAAGGDVRIEHPAVIDGGFSREILLQDGDCHTVETSGWIRLRAEKCAPGENFSEIICISPAPATGGLQRLIAKWRGKWSAWGAPAAH